VPRSRHLPTPRAFTASIDGAPERMDSRVQSIFLMHGNGLQSFGLPPPDRGIVVFAAVIPTAPRGSREIRSGRGSAWYTATPHVRNLTGPIRSRNLPFRTRPRQCSLLFSLDVGTGRGAVRVARRGRDPGHDFDRIAVLAEAK
jgi:hypothetical protein